VTDDNIPTGRLQDYPYATVRMACSRCDRQERHGKKTLIAAHGPDATMVGLHHLIGTCSQRLRPGVPCGAYFPDLIGG
jgi:hypothetical protein